MIALFCASIAGCAATGGKPVEIPLNERLEPMAIYASPCTDYDTGDWLQIWGRDGAFADACQAFHAELIQALAAARIADRFTLLPGKGFGLIDNKIAMTIDPNFLVEAERVLQPRYRMILSYLKYLPPGSGKAPTPAMGSISIRVYKVDTGEAVAEGVVISVLPSYNLFDTAPVMTMTQFGAALGNAMARGILGDRCPPRGLFDSFCPTFSLSPPTRLPLPWGSIPPFAQR